MSKVRNKKYNPARYQNERALASAVRNMYFIYGTMMTAALCPDTNGLTAREFDVFLARPRIWAVRVFVFFELNGERLYVEEDVIHSEPLDRYGVARANISHQVNLKRELLEEYPEADVISVGYVMTPDLKMDMELLSNRGIAIMISEGAYNRTITGIIRHIANAARERAGLNNDVIAHDVLRQDAERMKQKMQSAA